MIQIVTLSQTLMVLSLIKAPVVQSSSPPLPKVGYKHSSYSQTTAHHKQLSPTQTRSRMREKGDRWEDAKRLGLGKFLQPWEHTSVGGGGIVQSRELFWCASATGKQCNLVCHFIKGQISSPNMPCSTYICTKTTALFLHNYQDSEVSKYTYHTYTHRTRFPLKG